MISTPGVGCVNSNLCLFRLARTWRDDFVYGSGHGGTWLFWNSRSIQIQFRYSCGPGRARLRHFLLDADTRRVVTLFVSCLNAAYTHHGIEDGSCAVTFWTVCENIVQRHLVSSRDTLIVPQNSSYLTACLGSGSSLRRALKSKTIPITREPVPMIPGNELVLCSGLVVDC